MRREERGEERKGEKRGEEMCTIVDRLHHFSVFITR